MSHKTASSKLDAKALDKIALSVSSGLLEGAFFPITRKKSVIGRKVNAHIPIQDSKVSREHASIEIKDGNYVLKDLGSTNGTYLNNVKIDGLQNISVGDNIRIGSYTFKVEKMSTQGTPSVKWNSETRILYREAHLPEAVPVSANKKTKNSKQKEAKIEKMSWSKDVASWDWPSLRLDFPKSFMKRHPEQMKWLLWATALGVIFAASLTRFNRFS